MPFMNEMLPETNEAFGKIREAIFQGGELDRKTKELIAVACSVLMRCQYCVNVHSQRATGYGANKKRLLRRLLLPCSLLPVPSLAGQMISVKMCTTLSSKTKKSEEKGEGKGCVCGK